MTVQIESAEALRDLVGKTIGPTDWVSIEQDRVDIFAEATDDHQWIHVDVEAAATGPFGRTIAHGYLTVSLVPSFASQLYCIEFGSARLNYGLNKVRFPSPVPVGARVRATARFGEAVPSGAGTRLMTEFVVEIEGQEKPACVAETVVLVLP